MWQEHIHLQPSKDHPLNKKYSETILTLVVSKCEVKFIPNNEETKVPLATASVIKFAFKSNKIRLFLCLSKTMCITASVPFISLITDFNLSEISIN